MDVPALLAQALETVDGNQAELARRLGRSETTISRWLAHRNGIDYESALRLARMTGYPAKTVLEAAGLDPSLLPVGDPSTPSESRVELAHYKRLFGQLSSLLERHSNGNVIQPYPHIYELAA